MAKLCTCPCDTPEDGDTFRREGGIRYRHCGVCGHRVRREDGDDLDA